MSDGNTNAGREALPAGPEPPSITSPAELPSISAASCRRRRWTTTDGRTCYAAALDWPSWPGCCSGPERR